jgi:fatty-acyl-CoA synthase
VEQPAPADSGGIAVLLFTSGTTGEPKTTVLRHRHLTSYVVSTVEFVGADVDEAALICMPPYHIAGLSPVMTSTYLGRRMVQLEAFTPEDWVDLASAEQVTHALVVPTMLARVLDVLEARGERLPHLRHLAYDGGRMPLQTIKRAMALLPQVDFVNAYGLTEASVLAPCRRAALAFSRSRRGSCGYEMMGELAREVAQQ